MRRVGTELPEIDRPPVAPQVYIADPDGIALEEISRFKPAPEPTNARLRRHTEVADRGEVPGRRPRRCGGVFTCPWRRFLPRGQRVRGIRSSRARKQWMALRRIDGSILAQLRLPGQRDDLGLTRRVGQGDERLGVPLPPGGTRASGSRLLIRPPRLPPTRDAGTGVNGLVKRSVAGYKGGQGGATTVVSGPSQTGGAA
jgi:hypothetical protein